MNDGRPQKYTDEELLLAIKEYRLNHPNTKISLSAIARETNIPLHIWKYRMKDYIEELNNKTNERLIPNSNSFNLPSAHDMVINCNGDEKLIENNFLMLLDIINTLESYKNVAGTIGKLQEEYESKIHKLEMELKEKEKIIKNLNNTMNEYILDSKLLEKRNKECIKDNIIQFNRSNMDVLDEMFRNITK